MRDGIPCRLICIDIDGTLLNDAKEVLPEVKEAVKRQCEKNRKIALVSGRMPNKFLIAAKEKKTDEIQAEFKRWKNRGFDVARSSGNYLEIFPENVDKGKAVASLCAILNISTENVVAIGDHELDIPMIETAGIGIAMGNAIQVLKDKADFVTLTNNEAGVAHALNDYCCF